jgi:DNA-binding MurR/RpiR family transcriptional regulator
MTTTPVTTYDRAARIIMEAKGQVLFLGGRFSRHVAGMLAGYIYQFRSGVVDLGALSAQQFDIIADMGKRDALVVFDYRRYQLDVVAFAKQAAARGVKIVLFTDPWLSPVSEYSEATIVSPQEVTSPYDTLGPSIVQMEALVTHILSTISEATHDRIEALEDVRRQNAITLDSVRDDGRSALDEELGIRDFPGPKAR